MRPGTHSDTSDASCTDRRRRSASGRTRADLRGFTLIEMLVVMTITVVLATLAVPAFRAITEGAGIAGARSGLRAALELARSEAMSRATRVAVCRSPTANHAQPVCSDAAAGGFAERDWAAGWIVYAKGGANAGDVFEPGDVLIRRFPPSRPGTDTGRPTLWAPATGAVVYHWNGLRVAGPQGGFLVDWGSPAARPAVAGSTRARCLQVDTIGRVDVTAPVAGVCA